LSIAEEEEEVKVQWAIACVYIGKIRNLFFKPERAKNVFRTLNSLKCIFRTQSRDKMIILRGRGGGGKRKIQSPTLPWNFITFHKKQQKKLFCFYVVIINFKKN
jgi:hypothetical protein